MGLDFFDGDGFSSGVDIFSRSYDQSNRLPNTRVDDVGYFKGALTPQEVMDLFTGTKTLCDVDVDQCGGGGQQGDLDGDGDVDGNDILLGQRTDPAMNLPIVLANYGANAGTISGALVSAIGVPEPTTLGLCSLALVMTGWRRRRILT